MVHRCAIQLWRLVLLLQQPPQPSIRQRQAHPPRRQRPQRDSQHLNLNTSGVRVTPQQLKAGLRLVMGVLAIPVDQAQPL
jgi:hypothetical protein